MTFGSIDYVSMPICSSPAAVSPTKFKVIKTFGSVPVATATGHVNGKSSTSSRTFVVPFTASTSTAPSVTTSPVKPKIDIKKMFQSPSSAPSSNPPSDTSSTSMRNVSLPTELQQQQPRQGQSSHTPPKPSQLTHSFLPFVPSNTMRPQQTNDPNGDPPRSPQYPPPRSPQYPWQKMPPSPPPQMHPRMQQRPMSYYVSRKYIYCYLRISCFVLKIRNTIRQACALSLKIIVRAGLQHRRKMTG